MSDVDSRRVIRRARAVITGQEVWGASQPKALVLFNNRATPGHTTLMLPGGGLEMEDVVEGDVGRTWLNALQRELTEELGIVEPLSEANTTFILSRTYQFDGAGGAPGDIVELAFFHVHLPGVVPRNMEPEKVWSVDFVTVESIRRWVEDPAQNYKIQLGALDALEAVLDPKKNAQVPGGGGREISRSQAPRDPRARGALPYGGAGDGN